jgi:hypothetical protein
MQLYLPYPDIEKSVDCLDDKLVLKQIKTIENIVTVMSKGPHVCYLCHTNLIGIKDYVHQCLHNKVVPNRITAIRTPWYDHNLTQQWKGNLVLLSCVLKIHIDRCIKTKVTLEILNKYSQSNLNSFKISNVDSFPWWFGFNKYHHSHRCQLLKNNYNHYKQHFDHKLHDIQTPVLWPTEYEKMTLSTIGVSLKKPDIKTNNESLFL